LPGYGFLIGHIVPKGEYKKGNKGIVEKQKNSKGRLKEPLCDNLKLTVEGVKRNRWNEVRYDIYLVESVGVIPVVKVDFDRLTFCLRW
jgi:hypothetical protein